MIFFCTHFNDIPSGKRIFGREDLVQRHAILLSQQCGDTTSCIRQATFFSLISKENVRHVR